MLREPRRERWPAQLREPRREWWPDPLRDSLRERWPDPLRDSLRERWPEAPDLVCKMGQEQQGRAVQILVKWQNEAESGERMATLEELEFLREKTRPLAEAEMQRREEETAGSAAKSAPKMRVDKQRARSRWTFPAGPHAQEHASGVLEWVAKRVPKRINTEEIGDALEKIHRLVAEGHSSWLIYLTVARACVAVLWHTLRHGAEQLVGIVK
jgi:hypothetical protein